MLPLAVPAAVALRQAAARVWARPTGNGTHPGRPRNANHWSDVVLLHCCRRHPSTLLFSFLPSSSLFFPVVTLVPSLPVVASPSPVLVSSSSPPPFSHAPPHIDAADTPPPAPCQPPSAGRRWSPRSHAPWPPPARPPAGVSACRCTDCSTLPSAPAASVSSAAGGSSRRRRTRAAAARRSTKKRRASAWRRPPTRR